MSRLRFPGYGSFVPRRPGRGDDRSGIRPIATIEPQRGPGNAAYDASYLESKKAVESEVFTKSIDNIGDVVGYLDQPDFAKFWDEDAKRVEAAVQAIGKV